MVQPARPPDERDRRTATAGPDAVQRPRPSRPAAATESRRRHAGRGPERATAAGWTIGAKACAPTIRCWRAWCCSASSWSARPRPSGWCAGLPLEDGRLTPALALRAAARAGLAARLVRRPLDRISDLTLPCILLLEGRDCLRPGRALRRAGGRRLARDRRHAASCRSRTWPRATAAMRCSRDPSCASTARPTQRPAAAARQLVLGHAGAGLADLWRGPAGRGADQPVRAGSAAVHHERLRPGGAEPRDRDALGAGRRRAHGVPVRLPVAQPARLFRRQRRTDRRRQARQPDLRAGAGPQDGGSAGQRRRVCQQSARVREPARLLSPRRRW